MVKGMMVDLFGDGHMEFRFPQIHAEEHVVLPVFKEKKIELKPQLFVSRTGDTFDGGKILPVMNYLVKPHGGLWTSTFDVERKSEWIQFCEENVMNIPNKYWQGYLLRPRKDARIYVIDTFGDLVRLITHYPYKPFGELDNILNRTTHLDFEAISKDYDAIHLTSNGQSATRYSHPYDLYGWDFESTLWFRDCFHNVVPIRIECTVSKEDSRKKMQALEKTINSFIKRNAIEIMDVEWS